MKALAFISPTMIRNLALAASLLATRGQAENYALIVAGSNGYYNYRHQADAAHAYHILTDIGKLNPDNVVLMMYDDIADNAMNPTPGVVVNDPEGGNMYADLTIDYKGADCTAENFLRVLYGNSTAKNFANTTSEDTIFIAYFDHGATGLVAMPSGDPLYADELNTALGWMHDNGKYGKMVVYIEACESGSMFNNDQLASDMNIYATTAANGEQSSYACCYDDSRQVYLGDLYSVNWMEDVSLNMMSNGPADDQETLADNFALISKETDAKSEVCQFGDLSMSDDLVTSYMATEHAAIIRRLENKQKTSRRGRRLFDFEQILDRVDGMANAEMPGTMDSRDVKMETLKQWLRNAPLAKKPFYAKLVAAEKASRDQADQHFVMIANAVVVEDAAAHYLGYTYETIDYDCLRSTYQKYEEHCGEFTDYSLQYVRVLANLCDEFIEEIILPVIEDTCA